MRARLVALGIVLCALPANGESETDEEKFALTPIDELPTRDGIITLVGSEPVSRLRLLALSQSADFGVQLRAIRALPQFCTPTCKELDENDPPHPAREAVLFVIDSVLDPSRAGGDILRLRAGIEALGLIRSGAPSDLDLLVGFLDAPSRDVRAAAAHALGVFCHPAAEAPLAERHASEETLQVQRAIEKALQSLETCTPP
jgi:hypothetical protein